MGGAGVFLHFPLRLPRSSEDFMEYIMGIAVFIIVGVLLWIIFDDWED